MLLKNAMVVNERFELEKSDVLIIEEKIEGIKKWGVLDSHEVYDLKGCTILPGFIDIHIHGCAGADTGDNSIESLEKMSSYLATKGVTSFCPTSMTLPKTELEKIFMTVKRAMDNGVYGSYPQGVNMEGPYISMSKKGAQNGEYVRCPDFKEFKELYDGCGGIIKLVDIAPEEANADDFIKKASKLCTVSIAHTNADYDIARHSFEVGIKHATHLFNAMSGFGHRTPGVVGAVFETKDVTAEIICDGFHIHPSVLKTAFELKGEDNICIISDACSAAGMADCEIDLGGQTVYVRDGKARLEDGTIAASTSNIHEEFKNLISYGVPFKTVAKAASINPARQIGADKTTGSIEVGKLADIVVLDDKYDIVLVIVKGKVLVNNMPQ